MLGRLVQSILAKNRIYISRAEELQNVRDLISALRPMSGEKPLVRIGSPSGDGGYLLPDDFQDVAACISPGVSDEVGFDLQMTSMGIPVYMADASVLGPPVLNHQFHFSPLFLDSYSSTGCITLADYIKDLHPGRDLVLQMDIEGAEWRVINSTPSNILERFRIIVMEAHRLDNLFSKFGYSEINAALRKLLLTHNVVHIHPNNVTDGISIGDIVVPSLLEFTFHRKDRDIFTIKSRDYPHPLDRKNVSNKPDLILPRCWWPI